MQKCCWTEFWCSVEGTYIGLETKVTANFDGYYASIAYKKEDKRKYTGINTPLLNLIFFLKDVFFYDGFLVFRPFFFSLI